MPSDPRAPSLDETWSESEDGRTYEFRLSKRGTFHNGDLFTAEDVKLSLERNRGASAKPYREKAREIKVVNPSRMRFRGCASICRSHGRWGRSLFS
jgi:peptide/nickel transport system substrate-binding protein